MFINNAWNAGVRTILLTVSHVHGGVAGQQQLDDVNVPCFGGFHQWGGIAEEKENQGDKVSHETQQKIGNAF